MKPSKNLRGRCWRDVLRNANPPRRPPHRLARAASRHDEPRRGYFVVLFLFDTPRRPPPRPPNPHRTPPSSASPQLDTQLPYVNLLRAFRAHEGVGVALRGSVRRERDPTSGRAVLALGGGGLDAILVPPGADARGSRAGEAEALAGASSPALRSAPPPTPPSASSLTLPRARGARAGLTGRFLYLSLRLSPSRPFLVNLVLAWTDSSGATPTARTARVALGSMIRHAAVPAIQEGGGAKDAAGAGAGSRSAGALSLRLPVAVEAPGWHLVCIDMAACVAAWAGPARPGAGGDAAVDSNAAAAASGAFRELVSLQICADCAVRGAFTSPHRYSAAAAPREFGVGSAAGQALTAAADAKADGASVDEAVARAEAEWTARAVWVPAEPTEGSAPAARPGEGGTAARLPTRIAGEAAAAVAAGGGAAAGVPRARSRVVVTTSRRLRETEPGGWSVPPPARGGTDSSRDPAGLDGLAAAVRRAPAAGLRRLPAARTAAQLLLGPPPGHGRDLSAASAPRRDPHRHPTHPADRAAAAVGRVDVVVTAGHTPDHPRTLAFCPGTETLVAACGAALVCRDLSRCLRPSAADSNDAANPLLEPADAPQRLLLGHSAPPCGVAFSACGRLMASAQEGPGGAVLLWDFYGGGYGGAAAARSSGPLGRLLATLTEHSRGARGVDVSPDARQVAAVGLDARGRAELVVWGVEGALTTPGTCGGVGFESGGAGGVPVGGATPGGAAGSAAGGLASTSAPHGAPLPGAHHGAGPRGGLSAARPAPSGRGAARVVARSFVDGEVWAVRFSPHERGALVTLGSAGVRVWRLRPAGAVGSAAAPGADADPLAPLVLRSLAVRLEDGLESHPAALAVLRGNRVLDLAWGDGPLDGLLGGAGSSEGADGVASGSGVPGLGGAAEGTGQGTRSGGLALVGLASGHLVAVDVARGRTEAVVALHGGAVAAVAARDGVAATGSADHRLRLWGADFDDYLLEAEHGSPVQSVALSSCGRWAAAATADGGVGVLCVPRRSHHQVTRGHGADIGELCSSSDGTCVATRAADGTVRSWRSSCLTQTAEFHAPGATSLAFSPAPPASTVAPGGNDGPGADPEIGRAHV